MASRLADSFAAAAEPGAAPTVIIGTRVLCNYLYFDFRVSPVSEKLEHSKRPLYLCSGKTDTYNKFRRHYPDFPHKYA